LIPLTATNTGDAAANGVLPVAVDQLGTGGFNLVAPFSQTPVNLTKGTATTFNWTYSAIGTGTVSFSSSASALSPFTSSVRMVYWVHGRSSNCWTDTHPS
jgi:hypothetical protein